MSKKQKETGKNERTKERTSFEFIYHTTSTKRGVTPTFIIKSTTTTKCFIFQRNLKCLVWTRPETFGGKKNEATGERESETEKEGKDFSKQQVS